MRTPYVLLACVVAGCAQLTPGLDPGPRLNRALDFFEAKPGDVRMPVREGMAVVISGVALDGYGDGQRRNPLVSTPTDYMWRDVGPSGPDGTTRDDFFFARSLFALGRSDAGKDAELVFQDL